MNKTKIYNNKPVTKSVNTSVENEFLKIKINILYDATPRYISKDASLI